MNDASLRLTTKADTKTITELMQKHWGGEPLVVRAKKYYPSQLPGILAIKNNEIIGFLFYEIKDNNCEIIVFEVLNKYQGIGTNMLDKIKIMAKEKDCKRLFLMTSNDNLDALRFYQRRGFHICAIHIDSMKQSRKIKPGIPVTGDYNIPLRDEIDLEFLL